MTHRTLSPTRFDTISEPNTGILSVIGNTPLIELRKLPPGLSFRVYAKLEGINPGGSIKDRPAKAILEQGISIGAITPSTIIVESSSGNMGIGLAQACAYFGLRFICVVDAKTTEQNIKIMRAYGATVEVISDPDPVTGELLQARLKRVEEILRTVPGSFWPDQYSNKFNARAHHQTMAEIIAALGNKLDYLFCAAGTCGTMRGCAEYIRQQAHHCKLIVVDAVGSVIFGGQSSKRLIPGHGASIVPPLCNRDYADAIICVSDLECVVGCRRLVLEEAILAGGSSGAVYSAFQRFVPDIPAMANCVLIFPDRGERYLDTIYSDSWVLSHFGNIPNLPRAPYESSRHA